MPGVLIVTFWFNEKHIYIRRLSKKFVDFVNKIKSTDTISLKLLYDCSQFNMNKRGKFRTNHLINIVAMTIRSMGVSAKTLTSFDTGISVYVGRVKKSYKNIISHLTSGKF